MGLCQSSQMTLFTTTPVVSWSSLISSYWLHKEKYFSNPTLFLRISLAGTELVYTTPRNASLFSSIDIIKCNKHSISTSLIIINSCTITVKTYRRKPQINKFCRKVLDRPPVHNHLKNNNLKAYFLRIKGHVDYPCDCGIKDRLLTVLES